MQMSNKERIKKLLVSGNIKMPQPTKDELLYNFPQEIRVADRNNLNSGSICGCIVVEKEEAKKELMMHLICIYEEGNLFNISEQRIKGFIKSYDLKTDLSIFTYINSFQQIKPGAFINAVIRKAQKRSEEILYQMCLNKPNSKHSKNIKLGVIKDDLQIPPSIMKVYQKQKTLPMNFQILYNKSFDNPGLSQILIKGMGVSEYGSLHPISNIKHITALNLIPQRIRIFQERRWAIQHFEQGVIEIQNQNFPLAVDLLNIAKDFDSENVQVFIAKSCALVNMKNFAQGFKQIKEALKLDPKNKHAKKIYEEIHSQMTKRQKAKANTSSLVFRKKQSDGNNETKKS